MSRRLWLFLIIILGLSLRLYGINFGLPSLYHADEPIVVNHAMAYGLGDLNPHFFAIPPLVSYALFILYGLYFIIGRMFHIFASAESFAIAFLKDPSYFYLIARVFFGAIAGTATVYAIYSFARRLFSEKVGLISALFCAVAFIHVQNSHYIYVDIPMVLFVVLTCIASIDIIRSGSLRAYLMAGICAGIATAIKYNAAIVFIVILTAYFVNSNRVSWKKPLSSFAAMCASYAALNPYSVLDPKNFIAGIIRQAGTEYNLGALYHIRYSLLEGAGLALVFLGICGIVYYSFKEPKTHTPFLIFVIFFYTTLCFFSQPHERYILPLIPFLVVYSAALICNKVKNVFMSALLITVILAPNLTKSVYSDYLFTRDDTRTIAGKWIGENIKSGSKIAIEHSFFCPRLNQVREQIKEKLSDDPVKNKRIDMMLSITEGSKPSYYLFYLKDKALLDTGFLFERPQLGFSVQELKSRGVEYVIFHMDNAARTNKDFYKELLNGATLVKEFSPYKNKNKLFSDDIIMQTGGPFFGPELFSRERNGYIMKIFKLGKV